MSGEGAEHKANVYPFTPRVRRKKLHSPLQDVVDIVIQRDERIAEVIKGGVRYTFDWTRDLNVKKEIHLGSYPLGFHTATASKPASVLSRRVGKEFHVLYRVLVPHPVHWSWFNPWTKKDKFQPRG
jgi:hypothetical protein